MRKVTYALAGFILILSLPLLYRALSVWCDEIDARAVIQQQVEILRMVYSDWKDHGSKSFYDPDEFVRGAATFFVFTNSFVVDGRQFHCRFGCSGLFPPGRIAITDEGVSLYISDDNRRIIIAPEKNWHKARK